MFSYNSTGGALGPTQIRLLHLSPAADFNDPVESRLEVVALDQNPVYEALSYCWGDNTHPQEIKCNDQKFQATENLFSALQHLRNKDTERTLWIDAICINQQDLQERQCQVKLMEAIYTKSDRVVIWLGPDPASDGIHHIFALMQTTQNVTSLELGKPKFSEGRSNFLAINVLGFDSRPQGGSTSASDVTERKDFVMPDEAKKGALAMLKRPWWSRVWTVQEMVLAPSAIIMCGNLAAPSLDIIHACSDVFKHIVRILAAGDSENLRDAIDIAFDPDGMLYVATMRLHGSLDAKMELGIATSTYGIEPDYSISTAECYTRAAFNIISGSRSLDIFGALQRPSCVKATLAGLPSWVPDWSYDMSSIPEEEKGPTYANNPIIRENVRNALYLECRDFFPKWEASKSSTPFTARLINDGKTLILRGIIVDEFTSLGQRLEYPDPGSTVASNNAVTKSIREFRLSLKVFGIFGGVMDTIHGWRHLAFKPKILRTMPGETRMDAFLITMLSDRVLLTADRREVLDSLEQAMKTTFDMTKSGIVLNQLHISHFLPKLYHNLLGYRKLMSIDVSEPMGFGHAVYNLQWAIDQRMATTRSGYLCMVPWSTRAGDRIALLQGGRTPYVLRKVGNKWKILGDCYVHGIMSGEAWSDDKCVDIAIV
ncbi:heterokaryon incompatibility (het-6OR allele) [Fusarium subglutinans]|uniref:Heterokaryon incompatibility (Het-6OR allele) n=1 Tax=Gibberella subglutinans TaxID=42677 RepID=A0A8H5Q0N3_GIBSU|nr:heterokaryon incompatibility (het-6OR allele) [Fusarium subglutinans]KAF5605998.1 heterokaryon incompatibility (het-6OR allele) [Fusarium subglutinans]